MLVECGIGAVGQSFFRQFVGALIHDFGRMIDRAFHVGGGDGFAADAFAIELLVAQTWASQRRHTRNLRGIGQGGQPLQAKHDFHFNKR